MSLRQMAEARVRTSTSPGPGRGSGRSVTITCLSPGKRTAFMVSRLLAGRSRSVVGSRQSFVGSNRMERGAHLVGGSLDGPQGQAFDQVAPQNECHDDNGRDD